MPHMMPMLWLLIFGLSLIFLFAIVSALYFSYLPMKNNLYSYFPPSIKLNKWNWKW